MNENNLVASPSFTLLLILLSPLGGWVVRQQGVRYCDKAWDPVQAAARQRDPEADGGWHPAQEPRHVVEAEAGRRCMRCKGTGLFRKKF